MSDYSPVPTEDVQEPGLEGDDDRSGVVGSRRQRFLALLCAMCCPLGAHVCYKMTSAIEKYLLENMDINSTQYGELNSAVSWSSLALFPLVAGYLVDTRPTRYAALIFALVVLAGHLIFSVAAASGDFAMAVAGRAIFGMGESTITVVQGVICVQWFRNQEQMALAIGVTEMSHNVANWLGKISIEIGLALGGWEMTLWLGVGVCVLSVVVTLCYFALERNVEVAAASCLVRGDLISTKSRYELRDLAGVRELSALFWLFCLLHFLVSNVEHLFDAVSTDFINQKWDIKWTKAAWLSSVNYSLPVVLSPVVGLLLDRSSNRVPVAMAACALMTAGHFVLGFLPWTPLVGLLLLAVAESVLPTILRASVPLVVPHAVSGVAFGMYDVAENFGKIVGNPLVGYFRDQTKDYVLDEKMFVGMSALGVVICVAVGVIDARGDGVLRQRRRGRPSLLADSPELHHDDIL